MEAFRDFSLRAASASVRLVFYAGHGVQAKGRNYLLPVDADPRTEDDIARQSVDVGGFVDRLSALKTGTNVVVLDACRVNPFAGGVIVGPDGRRLKFRGSTPTGLAPLDAPVGTFVAFSTALKDVGGQVVVFFVLVVAAAEVVVGLGIIVAIMRRRPGADADDLSLMKG